MDYEDNKIAALAEHLKLTKKQSKKIEHDGANCYLYLNREEYLILTDEEAEDELDEALDRYIEEIIFEEIPERYHFYFDEDKWKEDARINDGRGHTLALYDGVENEIDYNGETYYIYRIN